MKTVINEIPPRHSRVKVLYEDGWSNGTVTTSIQKTKTIKILLDDGVEDTLEFDPEIVVQIPELEKNDKNQQNFLHDQTECHLGKGGTKETNKSNKREAKIGDFVEIFYEDGWDKGIITEILEGNVEVKVSLLDSGAEDIVEVDGITVKFAEVQSNVPNIRNTLSEKKLFKGESTNDSEHLQTVNKLEQKSKQMPLQIPQKGDYVNVLYEDGWAKCRVIKTSSVNHKDKNLFLTVDLGDGTLDELEYDGLGVVLLTPNDAKSKDSSQDEQIKKSMFKEKESSNVAKASKSDSGKGKQLISSNVVTKSILKKENKNTQLHTESSNILKGDSILKSNSYTKQIIQSNSKNKSNLSRNKTNGKKVEDDLDDNKHRSDCTSDSKMLNESSKTSTSSAENVPNIFTTINKAKNKKQSNDVRIVEKMTKASNVKITLGEKKVIENMKSDKKADTAIQKKKEVDQIECIKDCGTEVKHSSRNNKKCETVCKNDRRKAPQNMNDIIEKNENKVRQERIKKTNETIDKCNENFVARGDKKVTRDNEFKLNSNDKEMRIANNQCMTEKSCKISKNSQKKHLSTQNIHTESKARALDDSNSLKDHNRVSCQDAKESRARNSEGSTLKKSLATCFDLDTFDKVERFKDVQQNIIVGTPSHVNKEEQNHEGLQIRNQQVTKALEPCSETKPNRGMANMDKTKIEKDKDSLKYESQIQHHEKKEVVHLNLEINSKVVMTNATNFRDSKLVTKEDKKSQGNNIGFKIISPSISKMSVNTQIMTNIETSSIDNPINTKPYIQSTQKVLNNNEESESKDSSNVLKQSVASNLIYPNRNEEMNSDLGAGTDSTQMTIKPTQKNKLDLNSKSDFKSGTPYLLERVNEKKVLRNENHDIFHNQPQRNTKSCGNNLETRKHATLDTGNEDKIKFCTVQDKVKTHKIPINRESEGVNKNDFLHTQISTGTTDLNSYSKPQLNTHDVVDNATQNDTNKQIIDSTTNSHISHGEIHSLDCHTVFKSNVNMITAINKPNLKAQTMTKNHTHNIDCNINQSPSPKSTYPRKSGNSNVKFDALHKAKKADLRNQSKSDDKSALASLRKGSAKKNSCNNLASAKKNNLTEVPNTRKRTTRSNSKSAIKTNNKNITKKVVLPSGRDKTKDSPTHNSEPAKNDNLSIAQRTRRKTRTSFESPIIHEKKTKDDDSSIHSSQSMKIPDHCAEPKSKIDVIDTAKKIRQCSAIKTPIIGKTRRKGFKLETSSKELNSLVISSDFEEKPNGKTRKRLSKSISVNEDKSPNIKTTSMKVKNEENSMKHQRDQIDIQTTSSCSGEDVSKNKECSMENAPRQKCKNSMKHKSFDIDDKKEGEDIDTGKIKADSHVRRTRSYVKSKVKNKNATTEATNEKHDPQNLLDQMSCVPQNRQKSDMKGSKIVTDCNSLQGKESPKISKISGKESNASNNIALKDENGFEQRKRKLSQEISKFGSCGKSRPKKGDKVKVLYKHEGWLDASIVRVKRRKKGQTNTPIIIMLEKDKVEDQVEYDGEKVVKIDELDNMSIDSLKKDQNLEMNILEGNQSYLSVTRESKCNRSKILQENALSKSVSIPKQSLKCLSNTSIDMSAEPHESAQLKFVSSTETNSESTGARALFDQKFTQIDGKFDDSRRFGNSRINIIDGYPQDITRNKSNQVCQSTESFLSRKEDIECNSTPSYMANNFNEKKTISKLIANDSKFVNQTSKKMSQNNEFSKAMSITKNQKSEISMNTPDSIFDQKVAQLISLVMARSRGKVQNDIVENALSDIVSKFQIVGRNKNNNFIAQHDSNALEPDNIDYDIDENETKSIKKDPDLKCASERKELKWSSHNTTIEGLQQQNAKLEKRRRELLGTEDLYNDMMQDWESLDDIPLGHEGARMMITFGDGRCPRPGSVSAVLMVSVEV